MKIKAQQIRFGELWYRVEYAEPVSLKEAKRGAINLTKNFIEITNLFIEKQFVMLKPDELEKLERDLNAIEQHLKKLQREYIKAIALKEASEEART